MKKIINIQKRVVIVEKFKNAQEVWFKSILNSITHKAVDNEKYPDYIFFFKNNYTNVNNNNELKSDILLNSSIDSGVCFFQYNQKNGNFWCDYDKVWLIFGTEYNTNYQQTQVFIKSQVEEHFKLRGLTPPLQFVYSHLSVEEHFKLRESLNSFHETDN